MKASSLLAAIAMAAGMSFAMAQALDDWSVGIALGVGIAAAMFGGRCRLRKSEGEP